MIVAEFFIWIGIAAIICAAGCWISDRVAREED